MNTVSCQICCSGSNAILFSYVDIHIQSMLPILFSQTHDDAFKHLGF